MNQGNDLACKCEGTNGNPPADVAWYNSSGQIVMKEEKKKAILRFANAQKDDSGTYRCEAKSSEYAKNDTHIEIIVVG